MREKEYIQANLTGPKFYRVVPAGPIVVALVCILFSLQVAGQAISVKLNITDKIVLSEREPFVLRPAVDFTTKAKILEGLCVLTLTGADNLWVKATMPAFVVLRNELDERILCTANLSYRNDGQNKYNGKDAGNTATFPLSNLNKLQGKGRGPTQLCKAYLFVFIRTRLADINGDSYSGDVNLNIEYN